MVSFPKTAFIVVGGRSGQLVSPRRIGKKRETEERGARSATATAHAFFIPLLKKAHWLSRGEDGETFWRPTGPKRWGFLCHEEEAGGEGEQEGKDRPSFATGGIHARTGFL